MQENNLKMEDTALANENTSLVEPTAAVECRSKRERKQTAVFVVENTAKDTKDLSVPAGLGCNLGSIPAFEEAVTKFRGDDDVLKALHSVCFSVPGTKLNRKKNLRQFCGFAPDFDKIAIEHKISENKKKWTVGFLKEVCGLLSLERSGSREDLCKRVVEYLACPSERTAVKGVKKVKGIKRKRSSKSKGEPKAKRAPSAFILFTQANRELAKTENPGAAFADIAKVLGVMWNGLSEDEKKTWKDAAAATGGGDDGADTESGDEQADDDEAVPEDEEPTATEEVNGDVDAENELA